MKTYLANYLFSKNLISGAQCDDVSNIEYFLTKDNFEEQSKLAYKILFDEDPDPIVFTGHKFFLTKNPHPLFSRVDLMEKGLHLFRMIFARHAHNLRGSGIESHDNTGVTVIENFFDDNIAGRLKQFILSYPMGENIQPFNKIEKVMSKEYDREVFHNVFKEKIFPVCAKAVHREDYQKPAWDHFLSSSYVQRLENKPANGDIQKVCHSDVFYPCLKYWYFPEDVTDGTFMYAKGSTAMDEKTLDFFLRESIAVAKDTWDRKRNKGHGEGSFRALPQDLVDMDLKLEPITAKANSLVIADTSGFHCRGDVKQTSIRNAFTVLFEWRRHLTCKYYEY
jgi:hypothetical protein